MCALLHAWLAAERLSAAAQPYVFVLGQHGSDHAQPIADRRWTETVQAVMKRHTGVPLAPKQLRSSFITFLMSDENTDEALKKAVAHAMRHGTQQQQGPAHDKEKAQRLWAAAVKVAEETAVVAVKAARGRRRRGRRRRWRGQRRRR